MAVHADRTRGRKRGAPRPGERVPVRDRRRVSLSAGLATVALLTGFAAPAAAQQTVIIGGPAIIGPGAGGVIVNNEVLESLGPSPAVPALPYQAPGVMPSLNLAPGVGTVPGIAYRQPDTGQLLVTRPGRLLFPPPRAPRSRLAAEMPEAPMAKPEPKLTSRLLVPPPPQSATTPEPAPPMQPAPIEPVAETPVAAAEPPAPPAPPAPIAAVPALPPAPPPAPKAPEPQVAAQPEPSLRELSKAADAPPPPSTLAEELTQKPAPAEPSQEPAAVAMVEPAPAPEPVVQPAAPPAPAAATPPPAEAESEPPPAPAESLTAGPAVEPQTAALPPAAALAEQIRVLFQDGSAALSDDAKRRLSAVATALQENTTVRIQLLAYAKASSDGASRARRLSLSRALAVRAYLIEQGVRSTRMDVRALGDKIGDGPADRVDIRPQTAN
jgi:outer membrane protein OmpA-like peptidoglycan-associated protein